MVNKIGWEGWERSLSSGGRKKAHVRARGWGKRTDRPKSPKFFGCTSDVNKDKKERAIIVHITELKYENGLLLHLMPHC